MLGSFGVLTMAQDEPSRGKHSATKQIKLGSAIGLPLETLEPVEGSLRPPGRPFRCERRLHSRAVTAQSFGKVARKVDDCSPTRRAWKGSTAIACRLRWSCC